MPYDCPAPPAGLLLLRAFFDREQVALLAASDLLGGPSWRDRVMRLAARVAEATRATLLLRRELAALQRLLALDAVDDPDGDAAGCFAAINPADPVVHELCRLSEAFSEVLDALDNLNEAPPRRAAA
ncbi:hypothetical protein LAZ29_07175 [Cereibacter sphaeroides]|uniref:hypothetical protein n=1 Tax=Cereibacter sphaeroides TaxID=1063 RepID=UPI001F228508|nr:hypothetical protein [Cereibacter sphaeroides]MCE6950707.1 hypothetical protein [Cereibacter sphaeroides]